MALFRALSTSRSRRSGYDKLLDENNVTHDAHAPTDPDSVVLKRAMSVPARYLFGSSTRKLNFEKGAHANNPKPKPKEKKKGDKVHPVFSLFEGRWKKKKKVTANPDFSRYMEYLKEGGMWNKDTNSPTIYYK